MEAPNGHEPSEKGHEAAKAPLTKSDSYGSSASPNQTIVGPFNQPDLKSTKQTTDLDVTDLKLMHHFVTVVSLELSSPENSDFLAMWQVHFVNLGFKHDFLLRGILAVGAYHLAWQNPAHKAEYTFHASRHQSLALMSFQETLANVNDSNCHAIFAFSCLVIIMTFVSSTKDKPSDFTSEVLQWFYLLRGAKIVLDMHSDLIKTSFLKPLVDEWSYTSSTPTYTIPDSERITDLFRICGMSDHDRETSQAYTLAIHSLLSTFTQVSVCRGRGESALLPSFLWPIMLPPKFLESLGERQPEALVVLAHYCVIVYWCEATDNWFMGGWGRYMLGTIKETLPEEWQEHIKWADEQMN